MLRGGPKATPHVKHSHPVQVHGPECWSPEFQPRAPPWRPPSPRTGKWAFCPLRAAADLCVGGGSAAWAHIHVRINSHLHKHSESPSELLCKALKDDSKVTPFCLSILGSSTKMQRWYCPFVESQCASCVVTRFRITKAKLFLLLLDLLKIYWIWF